MNDKPIKEIHQGGIQLTFWLSEFLIIVFLLAVISGAVGVAIGSILAFESDRIKIEVCEKQYPGMRCELVAQGVQG